MTADPSIGNMRKHLKFQWQSSLFRGRVSKVRTHTFEGKRWPNPNTSIHLDDHIPQVMFLHFNQFCGSSVFIVVRNTGIMCWGYSLSLALWDDLVCVTVLLALGLEQSNTHSITPVTLAVNSTLSQAVCYNLNLYFVSDCDDLTEKNKRICLDRQASLEEVSLHLEV